MITNLVKTILYIKFFRLFGEIKYIILSYHKKFIGTRAEKICISSKHLAIILHKLLAAKLIINVKKLCILINVLKAVKTDHNKPFINHHKS